MRSGVLIIAVIVGVIVGVISVVYATTQAARPDEREHAQGPVRETAIGNFSNQQAMAILEEEIRVICKGSHPFALSEQLDLVRQTTESEETDHWRFIVSYSDYLEVRVFPEGNVSGPIMEYITRQCVGEPVIQ